MPNTVWLDGDALRQTICADLGYSLADRRTQVVRAGWVARLLEPQVNVVVSVITPLTESQKHVRNIFPEGLLVWVNTPLETCEARDVKGLYARDAPMIRYFTEPTVHDLEVPGHGDPTPILEKITRWVLESTMPGPCHAD